MHNTNDSDWRSVLKHEFEAGEGSFVLQLRCGPGWDKEAYSRLFKAMLECCKAHDGQTHIERWIVEGFWWLDFYPRYNSQRSEDESDFYESDYYENAVTNFNHLAFWLFGGEARADDEFEPI